MILFQLACSLSANHLCITAIDVKKTIAALDIDAKGLLLCDLSHLELSLVVAIRHHSEIYDRDPFNFEMVFTRLKKFENSSQNVNMRGQCDRPSAMKAFERLQVSSVAHLNTFRYHFVLLYFCVLELGADCSD